MRTVNIYREDGDTLLPVALGCVQTETADLSVTPNGKLYTMSDGSAICYPVDTAKTEMKLLLECSRAKAEAIRKAVHYNELCFEGIRIGETEGSTGTVYRAIITGTVNIEVKYAPAGIYTVTIPLRFYLVGEEYQTIP